MPVPEHILAKFLLPAPGPRLRPTCECNSTRIVWTVNPSRPGARMGICRRCAKVRFDVMGSQVLEL